MFDKLKIKSIGFDTDKDIFFYINKYCPIVLREGLKSTSRIQIENIVGELILVDNDFIKTDEIALSNSAFEKLKTTDGIVKISKIPPIKSFNAIKKKANGIEITKDEMLEIISDINKGYYTKTHIGAFAIVCSEQRMTINEITYLTDAMVKVGNRIKWDWDIVVDKHCIGGVPANRTTNVAIPIIASYGLHIPKTSSRAITSPSGTADTMEVLCNVNHGPDEIKNIVAKTNGCICWGGNYGLSPTDNTLIEIRKLLATDSDGLMVASVLSKKIAAGSTHILIVIPIGETAKVKDKTDFNKLKDLFEKVGSNLGVKVLCIYESGEQPIGNGIGPNLEALDIMKVLKNESDAPQDLKKTSLELAGKIIEFDINIKEGDGIKIATKILESGDAYKKFLEIAEIQGGLKTDIPTAKIKHDIISNKDGKVVFFDNNKIAQLCRYAGCPSVKEAGIYLYKHLNDEVKNGEILYTIHTNSDGELKQILDFIEKNNNQIIKID
jgi:thymidine phosphorylase